MVYYWRLALILMGMIVSEAVNLHCYNSSDLTKYEVATIENLDIFIKSHCLDVTRETYFYAFGYRGKVKGPATVNNIEAVTGLGTKNMILVNWEQEASSGFSDLEIGLGYGIKAIPEAISIGNRLGRALLTHPTNGLDLERIHMVGHSLGAHMMGYAGRTIKANGHSANRITGLDPASPLYNNALSPLLPLDSECADFVDCIHTDPGNYGLNKTCGTVDIWVNYGSFLNGTNLQPGCESGNFPKFSTEDLCSHDRSWKINNLALVNNKLFIASKAKDYYDWESQDGDNDDTIYLGDDIDFTAKGNYYLSTYSEEPYGKEEDGLAP